MHPPKLKHYKKSLEHSYTLGFYPTLELIRHSGEHLISIYVSSKLDEELQTRIRSEIDQSVEIVTNDKVVSRISPKENCYVIGVFEKFTSPLEPGKNHVFLHQPSDMGNLGTIIRTMHAMNVRNLALITPAADIFNPKVIRASMGSIFSINFEEFASIPEYQEKHGNNMYLFYSDGARDLNDVKFEDPFTLVFGNEAEGLPKDACPDCQSVRIPQISNVDSFNLSISVGIGLYEATS